MGAIKRDATDKWFSDAVRESFDYTCCRCGINMRHEPSRYDASHVKSRKYLSTRYFHLNAMGACRSCHSKLAADPVGHAELVKQVFGAAGYQELIDRSNAVVKVAKADQLEARAHWKAEHERICLMRRSGITGRIELTPLYYGYESKF